MIAFIGAGKVGTSLGKYFKQNGLKLSGFYSRSFKSAEVAAQFCATTAYKYPEDMINESEIIWITTGDDAIENVAKMIAKLNIKSKKTFLHASGLLTTDSLKALKALGHDVCSVHPLLAINSMEKASVMLSQTVFFLEGEETALKKVYEILDITNNKSILLQKEHKAAYHAGAVMLSNYLVTLLDASNQIFALTGIAKDDLNEASKVLLQSVLDNLEYKKAQDAITGPIRRGDKTTVTKHLEILEQKLPDIKELYIALGKTTMQMIGDYSLKEILENE